MTKTTNNKKIEFEVFQVQPEDIPKDRRVFSVSYSLLRKSHDIDLVLDYIFRKEEGSIEKEVGKLFHASVSQDNINILRDYQDRIDGTRAFLSPTTISNTYIISDAFKNSDIFTAIHDNNLEFEKKVILGLRVNGMEMYIKGFFDIMDHTNEQIIELKTTNSIKYIQNTIEKYDYDLQAYLYKTLARICLGAHYSVKFMFVSKFFPVISTYRYATPGILKSGEEKFLKFLAQIVELIQKHKLYYYFCLNKVPIL